MKKHAIGEMDPIYPSWSIGSKSSGEIGEHWIYAAKQMGCLR